MELAIPLLALGGIYVISNQQSSNQVSERINKDKYSSASSKNGAEAFANMGAKQNRLPNTEVPPQNYPIVNDAQLNDNVQNYPNPNKETDKYFNQNFYMTKENAGVQVGSEPPEVYSLTGNYMQSSQFKHNNMVPFNGGKVKGQFYKPDTAQSVLDNMAGTGSQTIKKIEQAPLFKPQADMQWSNGAPNMSDFYQSRVVAGIRNNNVKPFESEYVGPGLNQGYNGDGSGGFNSGMESREQWMPKNVDELRVLTNPKQEYTLDNLQGPALAPITNVGVLGKMEKNRPDTFFMNTQDRWFTTVGEEKGNRLVAEEVLQYQNRNDTSNYYAGAASSALKTSGYVPGSVQEPKRAVLNVKGVMNSHAPGRGGHEDLNNVLKSHSNHANSRSKNAQPETFGSGFSSAVGAVIAPFMDMLKPNRKEEHVSNIRVYGNPASAVHGSANYVINPYDSTNVTIKETTLFAPNTYIGNQHAATGGYTVSEQTPITNQRDSTNSSAINGVGGAAAKYGGMIYDAVYGQTNNEFKEKTLVNHPNLGGSQIFNQSMNVNIAKLDTDRNSMGFGAPIAPTPLGPMKENYGITHNKQQYDVNAGCNRLDGNLLSAFAANPYTHPLNSVA
jgi:hypothetical protein